MLTLHNLPTSSPACGDYSTGMHPRAVEGCIWHSGCVICTAHLLTETPVLIVGILLPPALVPEGLHAMVSAVLLLLYSRPLILHTIQLAIKERLTVAGSPSSSKEAA